MLRRAVVGVERNRDRLTARQLPAQGSERARTGQPIVATPDRYRAPPTVTCTMPSDSASANPFIAALSVCDDVTLMAGNAYRPAAAPSNISRYCSGLGNIPESSRLAE
jgi:hypothetical protein